MPERFSIADLHIGQANINFFETAEGKPLRPWGRLLAPGETLEDVSPVEKEERREAMDEAIVARWNAVVGPKDKVEVLGDVVINRRYLETLGRLNGKKRLTMGNHDIFSIADYAKYFDEMKGSKPIDHMGIRFMLTHIPMHVDSLSRWDCNLHGHLHSGRVMVERESDDAIRTRIPGTNILGPPVPIMEPVIDPRYFCVSVEHTNYTPMHFDEIVDRLQRQKEEFHVG